MDGDITQQAITSMVQAVNAKISPLDYEIRSAKDQHTNNTLTYALVNTTSDALTQLATTFTADQIAYIKRLLDAMFDENNTRKREVMAVRSMRAIQLAKAPRRDRQSQAGGDADATQLEANVKGISQIEADTVLATLVSQGFFHKSRHEYYSLAPRALMELRAYLKETYNDPPAEDDDEDSEPTIRIRDCEGCREIVTVGLRCSNRNCDVRWHDSCATQYFNSQQRNARRCPKCKADWTGDQYVGERADRTQSRSSTGGRSSVAQRMNEDEEDDEDE